MTESNENVSVCRFCLSELCNGLHVIDISDNIAQMVEILTSIKILKDDNLPNVCCLKCVENVNTAYKVREGIIEADKYLHKKIENKNKNAEKKESSEPKPKKVLEFSDNVVELISQTVEVNKEIVKEIVSTKDNIENKKEGQDSSEVDSPFEMVFVPADYTNRVQSYDVINLDEISEEEEKRIMKRVNAAQNQLLCMQYKQKLQQQHQQRIQQYRVQHQRFQQHHQRLLQQQRLHHLRLQQQQQRLQQPGLTQQQKLFEQQRLQQLQKQRLVLQQRQKLLNTAFKQSFNNSTASNRNAPQVQTVVLQKAKSGPDIPLKPVPFLKKCEQCGETIHGRYTYRLHMKKHQCKTCDICKVTVRADNFKKHMDNVHKDGPAVCEICGKVAKNKESLRGHMYYIHLNRNTHKCEHCEKEFRTKHGYMHHLRKTHLGIRNQQCDVCGKKFYSNYDVKKHINMTHKGARPHICPYCNKGFSSTNARKVHMRQHTLETPYQCEICADGFRQKVSLKTHMKSKHGKDLKEIEAIQKKLEEKNGEEDESIDERKDESSLQNKNDKIKEEVQEDEKSNKTLSLKLEFEADEQCVDDSN